MINYSYKWSYSAYPSVFFWHHKSRASFADLVSLLSDSSSYKINHTKRIITSHFKVHKKTFFRHLPLAVGVLLQALTCTRYNAKIWQMIYSRKLSSKTPATSICVYILCLQHKITIMTMTRILKSH